MKTIIIDNVLVSYIVKRTTTKKIYIRVKDGVVVVSATKYTTIKEITELLQKHKDFILKKWHRYGVIFLYSLINFHKL